MGCLTVKDEFKHEYEIDFKQLKLEDFKLESKSYKKGFHESFNAQSYCTLIKYPQNEYIIRKQSKQFLYERGILKVLQHEYEMLKIMHDCSFIEHMFFTFTDEQSIYLLTEYLNFGTLQDIDTQNNKLSVQQTKFVSAQILLALKYLHVKGFIYNNICLGKIAFTSNGYIKLKDLSKCHQFIDSNAFKNDEFVLQYWIEKCDINLYLFPQCINDMIISYIRVYEHKCRGRSENNGFAAPESILGHTYNQSVDIFAFGLLIYTLLTGETLFHSKRMRGRSIDTDRRCIVETANFDNINYFGDTITINLLKGLLCKNIKYRIGCGHKDGIDEILQHPYFDEIDFELLQKKKLKSPFNVVDNGKEFVFRNYHQQATDMKRPIMDDEFNHECNEIFDYVDVKHVNNLQQDQDIVLLNF